MNCVTRIESKTVVLDVADIDTDQILPARFLTTSSAQGLGKYAFADWRFEPSGRLRSDCPLNQVEPGSHRVLVVGHNFGCGSSREHAPWALLDYGIQAVISTGIGDIFRVNALKNALVPVVVDGETLGWLTGHPGSIVVVDIKELTLEVPGELSCRFQLDPFARYCLLQGTDELDYLLQHNTSISAFEAEQS